MQCHHLGGPSRIQKLLDRGPHQAQREAASQQGGPPGRGADRFARVAREEDGEAREEQVVDHVKDAVVPDPASVEKQDRGRTEH